MIILDSQRTGPSFLRAPCSTEGVGREEGVRSERDDGNPPPLY